jgi:hypothetical protein
METGRIWGTSREGDIMANMNAFHLDPKLPPPDPDPNEPGPAHVPWKEPDDPGPDVIDPNPQPLPA